jgi:hypothetical protein
VEVDIVDITFEPLTANNKSADVTVLVSRKGNVSLYGNMTLLHRATSNDEFEPVGFTNGVNVFHERDRNTITIPWTEKPYVAGGQIKVVFEGAKEMAGAFSIDRIVDLN